MGARSRLDRATGRDEGVGEWVWGDGGVGSGLEFRGVMEIREWGVGWAGRLGLCPVGLASWATDGLVGGLCLLFFCICLFSVFISFLLFIFFSVLNHFKIFRQFLKMSFLHNNYLGI